MATLTFQRTITPTIVIGKISYVVVLCMFIATVASLHLLHSNKSATEAYVIRKLEIQKSDLVTQNQILRMQKARAGSLPRLLDNSVTKNMVTIESPKYAQAQ